MEEKDFPTRLLRRIQSHPRLLHNLQDWYAQNIYRPYMVKTGVNLINPYDIIYTTRLHGMILSILLGKKTVVIDNSYGKNSSYYNTWLKDCDNVTLFA